MDIGSIQQTNTVTTQVALMRNIAQRSNVNQKASIILPLTIRAVIISYVMKEHHLPKHVPKVWNSILNCFNVSCTRIVHVKS